MVDININCFVGEDVTFINSQVLIVNMQGTLTVFGTSHSSIKVVSFVSKGQLANFNQQNCLEVFLGFIYFKNQPFIYKFSLLNSAYL